MVDKYTTLDGSLEFLAAMRFPREQIPIFRTAIQFWRDVLTEINRSPNSGVLLRSLRTVALRRTDIDRSIAAIINGADPRARQAADAGADGCHVILWTPTDRERHAARLLLVDNGLNPWLVWANSEMTSYAVSEKSARALDTRIRNLRGNLLYKVVPRGQPDDLLPHAVMVIGQDDREFPMYQVPVQLAVRDLADIAVDRHPSAGTALVGPAALVTYRNASVDPASTLLQLGFRDLGLSNLARVIVESLRFGKIRVLCIGASPEGMSRVDLKKEAETIARNVNLNRVELVGQIPNAKFDDLSSIAAHRPDIIHLSCHREGPNLIIEDRDNAAFPISAKSFADNLLRWQNLYGHKLSGIVLNSCAGEHIGPILLDATRTVIAHVGRLAAPRAEVFTAKLYHELSQLPVLDAAALLAAHSVYPDGEGLLILPPPPPGSR